MDLADLKRFDPRGMHSVYDRWPEVAAGAFGSDMEPVGAEGARHIVFAGMGGSGSIGDLFSAILSKSSTHVSLVKGYLLPRTADEDTLVVATSVSGDTVETLTVLKSAVERGCRVIAFSSGGRMESFCAGRGVQFRRIPQIHSPRTSYPAYAYSIIKALLPLLRLAAGDVEESISAMRALRGEIGTHNLTGTNPALGLSGWISGIPAVYFPAGLQAAAIRFKNSMQENAKTHIFVEDVIEACHNGIVSWEGGSGVSPILVRGSDDYPSTKERWEILKDYFRGAGIAFREVPSVGGGIIAKVVCLVYLLDFASIYYAVRNGVDPSPVRSIDYVKGRLRGGGIP